MAVGDLTLFNDFVRQLAEKEIDLADDEYKIALFNSTRAPVATESSPVYSTSNEVTGGTSYSAGGAVCSSTMSVTLSGATVDWDASASPAVSWSQDASGPTNIRWGILYNNTAAAKPAAAFIVFGDGSDLSLVSGDISFTFNATAIAQITRS